MLCSFYGLYCFMEAEHDHSDRTIIVASIVGAIVSLVGLIMAVVLDQLDQKRILVPTHTITIDDLPKLQPIIVGVNNADP